MNRSVNEIAYRADFAKRCRKYADAIEAVLEDKDGRVYPDGDAFFVVNTMGGRVYIRSDLTRSPAECAVSIIENTAILTAGTQHMFGTRKAAELYATAVGGAVYNTRELLACVADQERWIAFMIENEANGSPADDPQTF